MPPANSPVNNNLTIPPPQPTTRTPSPSTLVPALRAFGSSVPDLASTLTIQAENDVDADNVNFLRSPGPSHEESGSTNGEAMDWSSTSHTPTADSASQQRQRSMLMRSRMQLQEEDQREQRRLRDLHLRQRYTTQESWAESMRQTASTASTASRPPYGDRPPNQQSLYDWAPASEEGDPEELEDILADLREQQPNTHNDILRVLARAQLDAQNEHRRLALSRTQANSQALPASHEQSLRSAAILRSVRANRQLSARSRDLMQRYVMDRERASSNGQDSAGDDQTSPNSPRLFRSSASTSGQATSSPQAQNDMTADIDRLQREREREERRSAFRAAQLRLERAVDREASSSSVSTRPAVVIGSSSSRRSGETMESLRRRYLEDPAGMPYKFENSIKILDWLRNPDFDLNDLLCNLDKEFGNAGLKIETPDLDRLISGFPPPETSWLQPGMVFSGFQHAASVMTSTSASSNTTYYRLANDQTISSTVINPPTSVNTNSVPPGVIGSTVPSTPPPTSNNEGVQRDRWAVRMSIHNVDYKTMTLQGTMEAFDAPSSTTLTNPPHTSTSALRTTLSPSPPQPPNTEPPPQATPPRFQSTFSTFVEGELLDLRTHSLATHSFPASTVDDAKYWRRLPPFARAPDHTMSRNAVDPTWLAEELQRKYVLMRWKERCFVKECLTGRAQGTATRDPAAHAGGIGMLSISGFYYVSLRRDDGHIEGLYFDPASSPYQHLELTPEGARGKCAWEFA